MVISEWSSNVCSSDLTQAGSHGLCLCYRLGWHWCPGSVFCLMAGQGCLRMNAVAQHEITGEEDGIRLDRWFKRHFPSLTHGRLEKLLRTGQVRVDGARAKANRSEERRVGKGWVSKCRSGGSP